MSASKWHFRVNLWVNVQISSLIWVKVQIPRDSLLGWVEVCPQIPFSAFQSQPLPFPCPVCRRQLQREVRFPSSGLTPSLQPRSITVTWAFHVSEHIFSFCQLPVGADVSHSEQCPAQQDLPGEHWLQLASWWDAAPSSGRSGRYVLTVLQKLDVNSVFGFLIFKIILSTEWFHLLIEGKPTNHRPQ